MGAIVIVVFTVVEHSAGDDIEALGLSVAGVGACDGILDCVENGVVQGLLLENPSFIHHLNGVLEPRGVTERVPVLHNQIQATRTGEGR